MENQKQPEFVRRSAEALSPEYRSWFVDLKARLHQSQVKASVRVNSALLEFYWSLGRDLVAMKAEEKWGSGVVDQLSLDLKAEFPGMKGFSATNIRLTRQWYVFYRESLPIQQQAVVELEGVEMPPEFGLVPWGHHVQIFRKSESVKEALFYIAQTIEGGWSRSVLKREMESGLYSRQGKAISNFAETLPTAQSELAQSLLKDPYCFDFLSLSPEHSERELEDALMGDISRFLLELGAGFAFVGRQMELRLPSGESYYPDMVFYHIPLRAYVIIELKVVDFMPEFAGKLNFYVSAADHLLRGEGDNPSIGLLICRSKDDTVVRWSFEGNTRPLGVASYEIDEVMQRRLATVLPTEEVLRREIESACSTREKAMR